MASLELQAVVELLRAQPDVGADFPTRRANMEEATAAWPVPDGAAVDPVLVDGVPCEWVTAEGAVPGRGDPVRARRRLHHRLPRHAPPPRRAAVRRRSHARPQRGLPAGPRAPAP